MSDKLKAMLLARAQKLKEDELARNKAAGLQTQISLKNVPNLAVQAPLVPRDEEASSKVITYNEQQSLAIEYAREGKEFCLIGAAGTGKTTTLKAVLENLMTKYNVTRESENDKTFAVVCFTRRASRNAAKALASIGADKFCMTAHAFLEYQPEYIEYLDSESGSWKKTMRFSPTRTSANPIRNCKLIVIDEASMLDYKGLYQELYDAAPNAKFIFVGDLNQLPPVFGNAVLGYKLFELPVVELTTVYRQAMDSPIIAFQHNFTLAGKKPSDLDLQRITDTATAEKGLDFIVFKKDHADGEVLAEAVASYMIRKYEAGDYDPYQDTILIPFNKSFGSIVINWHIAESLGHKRNAVVWEIFAGLEHKYFAVGDFVMFEKAECEIIKIEANPKYFGKPTQNPNSLMRRNGLIRGGAGGLTINLDNHTDFVKLDVVDLLEMDDTEAGELKRAASAIITLRDLDNGREIILSSNGEINGLEFGYCMTIHKSQGSEWRKVWLVAHKFHAAMLSRELLYTGMTRAKEKLTVIYSKQTNLGSKDSSIAKAVAKAVIPGKTWQQKTQYFKSKADA